MLAVSVSSQLNDVFADVSHNGGTLAFVGNIDNFLDHVVGVRISNHGFQHAVTSLGVNGIVQIEGHIDDGPDHFITISLASILKTLLNNIGCKLMLRELKQVGLNFLDEDSTVRFPTVLHNKLDDVISVAILNQIRAALTELLQNN